MLQKFLKKLFTRPSPSPRIRVGRQSLKPSLETLEDRSVPSALGAMSGGPAPIVGLVGPAVGQGAPAAHGSLAVQDNGLAGLLQIKDDRHWGPLTALDGTSPVLMATVAGTNHQSLPQGPSGGVPVSASSSPLGNDPRVIYAFNPQPEPPGLPIDLLTNSALPHGPAGDPLALSHGPSATL